MGNVSSNIKRAISLSPHYSSCSTNSFTQKMTFPFHDPTSTSTATATSTAFLDHMPPVLSIHQDNNLSMNVNPLYHFPNHPWATFDPTSGWHYPPAQVDPRVLIWPTVNNIPLASHGTASTNYFHTETPSSTMNQDHTSTQGPPVKDTFAAPIATSSSASQILETTVYKHTSPHEQTAYKAQKTKITK
jgi:hypothetical protein